MVKIPSPFYATELILRTQYVPKLEFTYFTCISSMVIPRGPCSLDISAISHGEPWGEAAAKLTVMHRASPRAQSQSRGSGIPRELHVLPCLPAPVGSRHHWKHSSAPFTKEKHRVCSHLFLIYAMVLCNFPKADGQFSSFRQESGPRRLTYFSDLLACDNRLKAEKGSTPYCKCTHAAQTQLMPDVQMLTLLIRSLCYCMAD